MQSVIQHGELNELFEISNRVGVFRNGLWWR
jgi:hypothetical protein